MVTGSTPAAQRSYDLKNSTTSACAELMTSRPMGWMGFQRLEDVVVCNFLAGCFHSREQRRHARAAGH